MTGEGVVVSLSGENAVVRICKSSACSHDCSSCGACKNPTFDTLVKNPVGAKEGDKVLICSPSGKLLFVSLVVYILPVILLVMAAVICESFKVSSLVAVLIFAVVILLWIFLIRFANRHIHTEHTIIEILKD